MIVISNKQLEDIKELREESWQKEFEKRLREDLPEQTSHMSDGQLAENVKSGRQNAKELEILEKEDVYRFLKIGFLPKEFLEDDFNQSALIRVLNNTNLSGAKRLDFIEQQLTARANV